MIKSPKIVISIIRETKEKSTQTKNKRINWLNSQLKQARMRQNFVQIVKLILDDKRINSNFIDTAFEFAYFNNYISVARTLWNNKRFNKYKKNFDKKTYFKIYIQEHINNF